MLNSYRKNDPVLFICQNNANLSVEIGAVNAAAETIIGYSSEELAGKPLHLILPDKINTTVQDIVEYEPGARDIADALLKCRDFAIRNKTGTEVPCKMRIVRCAPIDRNEWFQVVLLNQEEARRTQVFRDVLRENFKGHEVIDPRTGMPDRASLLKDLELAHFYARQKDLFSCFALVDIDKFDQYQQDFGAEIALSLFRHVAGICRRTLRGADSMGLVNEGVLGCVLMDTNRESARMACNRLRWTIAASPMVLPSGLQINATVSIIYAETSEAENSAELLSASEKKLKEVRADSLTSNGLHFAVTRERRAKNERRKQNVPVTRERRRNDRRKID